MSDVQTAAPPRDVYDNEFKELMEFYKEDRKRTFGEKQRVLDAFATIRKELIGKNDITKLQAVAKSSLMDDSIDIDITCWRYDNDKVDNAMVIIDGCYSLLFDIYFIVIPMLTKNDTLKDVKLMQPLSMAGQSISPQMIVEEKAGFFDRLSGIKDSLSPKWKKDYKQGFGLLNDKLQDMNNAAIKWEKFCADHWDKCSQTMDWNAGRLAYELVEEIEALTDCRRGANRLLELGYRLLTIQQEKRRDNITSNILQAKTAAMSQQQMMMGGGMGFGQQPMMGQGQPAPQLQAPRENDGW